MRACSVPEIHKVSPGRVAARSLDHQTTAPPRTAPRARIPDAPSPARVAAFVALEEEEGVGTPAVSVELRSEGKGTTLVSPGKVAMDVLEGVMTDDIRLRTTDP